MDEIIQNQCELYGRIARSVENLKKLGQANITTSAVQTRLANLEKCWTTFEQQHARLRTEFRDAVKTHDYVKKDYLSLAEEAYLTNKGEMLDYLSRLQAPVAATASPASTSSDMPRTTLPRIQLPQFSGKYEDWPSFRDLFQSIFERNAAIQPVEKLHYLKSCLKGEAELLIRNLATTNENFSRAWALLTTHFENQRLLVRSYISQFTALQRLKGESAADLRHLYHNVRSTVDALESIKRPITAGEDLFVYLIIDLLDPRSRREWETSIGETSTPPTYKKLERFLERRIHTLESLQPVKGEAGSSKGGATKPTRSLQVQKQDSKRGRCSLCYKDHYILFCSAYKAKSAEERKRHIDSQNLCLNCLGQHKVSECASRKACTVCNERHHTTLHDACSDAAITTSHLSQRSTAPPVAVLLATARVRVADRTGVLHEARALIDQGSESSLVTESLAQRLRLPRSPASVTVLGVGGVPTGRARGLICLQISSRMGGPSMEVTALVFPRLTIYESCLKAKRDNWEHLSGLELADPDFLASDPVDLLLGADFFTDIIQEGLRKGCSPRAPIAQRTKLGWILSGAVSSAATSGRTHTNLCHAEDDLTSLVRQFWLQEELPTSSPPLSAEDQACEEFFRLTHSRNPDGRYVVRLPVKEPLPDFAASRVSALRVLNGMERRFVRETRLHQLYVEFMRQYQDLEHMTPVVNPQLAGKRVSYLPHHGVLREASTTTKLRVVFNTPLPAGQSLNRRLMIGPNLLPQLSDVLLRWRRHRYVLATDVEKMYRQILVHPDDRDLQRILWRYEPQDRVTEYQLNTVTYGLSCAPYLAMRTLHQLAADERERFPLGAAALTQDAYMDDVLTGADTLDGARILQNQLNNLCMAGGFPLRKWSANNSSLLVDVPADYRALREPRAWRPQETHSTLGLQWHPGTDHFSLATRNMAVSTLTKRSVLSLIARLFDPLGWLAPTVVGAKIAFQSTWLHGLDWDAPLDKAAIQFWQTFLAELPQLEVIRIPRWIGPTLRGRRELHGFADASERAYAAVICLRSEEEEDAWRTTLVTAKTKVAPIKPVTLPRLELCAASLLVRLAAHVRSTLDLRETALHCWSDSTVVLAWIRGHPTRWKTFVANRVSEIQTSTPDALWHHIPGKENPADCASRGLSPGELVKHALWWQGPPWLASESQPWPAPSDLPDVQALPEERTRCHVAGTAATPSPEPEELTRFSSLNRLLRVTAWCRRWLRARRPKDSSVESAVLDAPELDEARRLWIRQTQAANFPKELDAIRQGQALSNTNALTRLSPFLDSQKLLRVGGRLKHSLLDYDERHSVILPCDSHFTRLIVEACHRRALHGGVQLTLSTVRQRYWLPKGRSLVKSILHRCVTCVRWRAATPHQLMGDLPRERVTPARPFLNTGVDYAGPMLLRTSKGRGHRAFKAFIAVFICLSSRAVHLEVVSDYTADAFLAALRRFVSRRGLCSSLWSDCGTIFVGADAQLRNLFAASSPEHRRIVGELASDNIRWRFNPPAAPHFGGIWEAAVKSVKHHLRRVLGDATLTFEEMSTLISQIEACLNSRPLQAFSDDPGDLAALTPGHFLVGSALTAIPEPSLIELPAGRLSRWQLLQKMRDHFWQRWSQEYLHALVHRPKWWKKEAGFEIGRLCLIRHENTPPTRWPLARIVSLHPGEDGQVRVVTVRTAASQLKRPISKLVLLPISHCDAASTSSS